MTRMAISLPIIIMLSVFSIFCILTAFGLGYKRSWTIKLMIWGLFSMFFFTPIISYTAGEIALYQTQDGWVGMGTSFSVFVILEIISILSLMIGSIGFIRKQMTKKVEPTEKMVK